LQDRKAGLLRKTYESHVLLSEAKNLLDSKKY